MTRSWAARYRWFSTKSIQVPSRAGWMGPLGGVLDRRLGGDPELVLEVHDPGGVVLGPAEVTDRDPAGGAVEEVREEEEADLRARRRRERGTEHTRWATGIGGEHGPDGTPGLVAKQRWSLQSQPM